MMVANSQRLFLVERRVDEKICKQCSEFIPKYNVCFSKRHKQYYCAHCAISLGYIRLKDPQKAFLEGMLVGNR